VLERLRLGAVLDLQLKLVTRMHGQPVTGRSIPKKHGPAVAR